MKRSVLCIVLSLAFVFVKAQIGVYQKVLTDSIFSKDYRFKSIPNYSIFNALSNITAGEQNLSTPPGTTAQRPTVPSGKIILRFNTDSNALEFGNSSQVWRTLAMSSIQTLDTSSIPNFYLKVRSLFSASSPLLYNGVTGNFSIQQSSSSQAGYLSQADWVAFNAKLPDPGSNGLLTRTSLGTVVSRQLVAASSNISIVNPNGVSGNPSIDINSTPTFSQLILTGIPSQAANADSVLTINRSTNMLEVHPVSTGGGSGTFNKAGGGISYSGDSLYLNQSFTRSLFSATSPLSYNSSSGAFSLTTVPINLGGTNSTTALSNNRVMQSSSGSIIEAAAITANRALISDANGIPTHSTVTSTELGYVSGVTSAIQTQLNSKISNATGLISAGTNISITGSGTSGSPYVINSSGGSSGVTQVNSGSGLLGGPITTTGILKVDTTFLKSIYTNRTGVRPTGYASASIIVDTAGRVRQVDAIRNNLVSVNNVGTTTAFGKVAAHFDWTKSQALVCPSNPTLQGNTNDYTICAWAKMDALTTGNMVLVSKDDNRTKRGSEQLLGFVRFGTDKFQYQVEECCHLSENDGTTWLIANHTTISTGQWYFVVGQYNHTAGKIYCWVNMVKDSLTGVPNIINTTNTPFVIGGVSDDWDTTGLPEPASYWNGAIKSVMVFHRVLDSTELLRLYNNTPAQLPPPGANPATMNSGASFSVDVPSALSSNVNSVSYDGSTGKSAMQSGFTMNAGASSISFWFKAASFGGIPFGNTSNANCYIRILNSTTIRIQTITGSTFQDFTVPTMSTGTWYNVVFTRGPSNLTHCYLNGTQSSSGGLSQTDPITFDELGTYWDGSVPSLQFAGKLSDVRFYNSVLSSGDIAATQTNSPTIATPATWYKLNEGSGTVNFDYGTAPVPHPLVYSELPTSLIYESRATFVSHWDLDEPDSTTRYDARNRNTLANNGVYPLHLDISHQDQNYFGSNQPNGNLWLNSTVDAAKGFIHLDSNSVFDGANRRLGIGLTNPDLDFVIKNATTHAISMAFRDAGDVNTLRIGVDADVNSFITAYGSLTATSSNSNPISFVPATGVTISSSGFSTPHMLEVKEDRTGLDTSTHAIYAHMTNAMFNTSTRSIIAAAVMGIADGQRSSGSNPLTNVGIYGDALNGQNNWAGYFNGKVIIKTMDSTSSPVNMLYQDIDGQIKKTAVPGGSSYTFTNGLTNSSGTVSLGGTLTGTTTINGASNFLNIGASGSTLNTLNLWAGSINVNGILTYRVDAYNTDANYTVPASTAASEILSTLTTGRTLTLPSPGVNGQTFTIVTRYSTNTNKFTTTNTIRDNSTGTAATITLDWGKTYDFMVNAGLEWMLIRKY